MDAILSTPHGPDTLPYYYEISPYLLKFLDKKELATRIWISNGPKLLKRGSQLPPLYIGDLKKNIDSDFFRLRKLSLDEAKPQLTQKQTLIWKYFFPRKNLDLFYATNNEGVNKPLERIYFDIDRKDVPEKNAQEVCLLLIEEIKNDSTFNDLVTYTLFPLWTGKSFHLYLLLKKIQQHEFYERYIQYSKNEPLASLTGKWIASIQKKVKIKVIGGHEKLPKTIVIDPSQTPSGKLARAPFSLHMKDAKTVDGVSLPLTEDDLKNKNLINELKKYTPDMILKNIEELSKKIPK